MTFSLCNLGTGKVRYTIGNEQLSISGHISVDARSFIINQFKDDEQSDELAVIVYVPRHLGVAYITEPAKNGGSP